MDSELSHSARRTAIKLNSRTNTNPFFLEDDLSNAAGEVAKGLLLFFMMSICGEKIHYSDQRRELKLSLIKYHAGFSELARVEVKQWEHELF